MRLLGSWSWSWSKLGPEREKYVHAMGMCKERGRRWRAFDVCIYLGVFDSIYSRLVVLGCCLGIRHAYPNAWHVYSIPCFHLVRYVLGLGAFTLKILLYGDFFFLWLGRLNEF